MGGGEKWKIEEGKCADADSPEVNQVSIRTINQRACDSETANRKPQSQSQGWSKLPSLNELHAPPKPPCYGRNSSCICVPRSKVTRQSTRQVKPSPKCERTHARSMPSTYFRAGRTQHATASASAALRRGRTTPSS